MKYHVLDLATGPRHFSRLNRWLRAVWLFARIVYRLDYGFPIMPSTAWDVASGIWDSCECYNCNPGRREAWMQ